MPPDFFSGFESGLITSCLGVSFACAASSAIVLPVTVSASPCRRPASSNRLASTRMPPAR